VTIALVLVAAIALVIGFVSNQLPPIYISIACSFVAAVVLAMFSRLNRRRAAPASGSGPAPLDTGPSIFERSAPPTTQSPAIRGARPALEEPEEEEAVTAVSAPATKRPAARAEPVPPEPEEEEDLWPDEIVFPIEDYDDLRTAEILPLLEELDDDELEDVRDYEEDHRRRASILRRIDELLRGEEELAPPPPVRPKVEPVVPPIAPSRRPAVTRHEPEPEPAPPPPLPPRTRPEPALTELRAEPDEVEPEEAEPSVAAAAPAVAARAEPLVADDEFPIADYDKLRVAEILPLLSELEPDELEQVAERERAGSNRTTVLTKINRLLRPEKVKTTGKAAPAKAPRPPAPRGFRPSNGPSASSQPDNGDH
jgi:hypothetical protein